VEIRWKQGSQFKSTADVAHDAIELIRKKHGGSASAEQIVLAAKAARNPLHVEFEWDDETAAHEHRLHRARVLMHSFVVVRSDLITDRPQRVYEVVREPQEGKHRIRHVYKTIEDIMKDTDLRAELLGRALGELISIRNRYRDLQELAIVLRAIDEVVEQLTP
jgi:arylsulfatase A-like enzyme